jgi:hypothetical protein
MKFRCVRGSPVFPFGELRWVCRSMQVRELAEKEKEEGLGDTFRLLQKDVTRFLTTILIGST